MNSKTNQDLQKKLTKIRQDFSRAVDTAIDEYNGKIRKILKRNDEEKLAQLRKHLNT